MFDMMLESWLLEVCGDCLLSLLTLEENVADVGEDTEVVEQEYPVQDSFEQGKLPLTCTYATIFKMVYHQEFLEKEQNLVHYVWQDILPPLIISN